MKAALVIMAAGLGSRYGGNKQVDGVGPNGEILMEYSIYDAIRAGFTKIVFVIKPGMEEMRPPMRTRTAPSCTVRRLRIREGRSMCSPCRNRFSRSGSTRLRS